MAVSMDSGGKPGGRKPLGADLNLVPYIDLLTCMVAFLLITAVWTQLARLKVQQHVPGDNGPSTAAPPETRIAVEVADDGFVLVVNATRQPIATPAHALDYDRLIAELKALKASHPDKTDVEVVSNDAITFDTIVRTMDTVMASGFPDVSLLGERGEGI